MRAGSKGIICDACLGPPERPGFLPTLQTCPSIQWIPDVFSENYVFLFCLVFDSRMFLVFKT